MKQRFNIRALVVTAVALVMVMTLIAAACAPQPAKPTTPTTPTTPAAKQVVKYAGLYDFTGPVSAVVTPVCEGMMDYDKYMNDKEAIPGIVLEEKYLDTKYDFSIMQSQYLANKNDIVAVGSMTALADYLTEVTPTDKVVAMAMSATPKAMFPAQPWIFLETAWMPDNSAASIKWFKENVYKGSVPMKLAIVVGDIPAGRAYIIGIPKYCKENGIDLVVTQPVPPAATDMSSELLAVSKLKPDLILSSQLGNGFPVMLKNMYELGIKIPVISNAAGNVELAARGIGPEPCEGAYSTHYYYVLPEDAAKYPLVKLSYDLWEKRHPGIAYTTYHALGMAMSMVKWEALKRAVEKNPGVKITGDILRKDGYMSFTKPFDLGGLCSAFDITPGVDHIGFKQAKVIQLKGGKPVVAKDYFTSPAIRPPFE